MSLEIKGRLIKKLEVESGTGANGEWKKQQFVIETEGDYPKSVCIVLWGDKVDLLAKYKIDDNLTVSINLESREYNNRWYSDIKAWRIETSGDRPDVANNTTTDAPLPDSPPSDLEIDEMPF